MSPPGSTALELQTRSIRLAEVFSAGEWPHPDLLRWLAPDFEKNRSRNSIGTKKVLSANADVNEQEGKASVWVLLKTAAPSPRVLPRENLAVFRWRRERGSWRCYEQTEMDGVAGYAL
jgi:hypothetical protein